MTDQQRETVRGFTSEIDELHPALQKLLPRLPRVSACDYTHGTAEFGADFIITRTHETFGTIEHIGIIAKLGGLHQNIAEVERQIEECTLVPRTILAGRHKVHLNEVWVVVSGKVSKGAEEKIFEKFSRTKIIFVEGRMIDELLSRHLPHFWTDVAIEVSDYLGGVRSRSEATERNLSLLPPAAQGIYIKQQLVEFSHEKASATRPPALKKREISILDELQNTDLFFIEGGMGAGKSRLLRYIAVQLASVPTFLKNHHLPVLSSFRHLQDEAAGSLKTLLLQQLENVPEEERSGTTVVALIDGLDELKVPEATRLAALEKLAKEASDLGNVKVIVGSRPFAQPGEIEGMGFRRLMLRSLSTHQLVEFLSEICSRLSLSTRLVEDLKNSNLFKSLPKNPIAAILLARLMQENERDLPANLTELYKKYAELALGRWDLEKGLLRTLKEYEVSHVFAKNLAAYFMENQLSRLSEDEALERLKEYLSTRNLELSAKDVFGALCDRCDLFSRDPETRTIGFKHRTFAEFFYAEVLKERTLPNVTDDVFSLYWRNTYFFLIGLLGDAPELLERIISLKPKTDLTRWLKFWNLGEFLLAGYRTPYNVIEQGVLAATSEAGALYLDVRSRRSDSSLSALPPVTLLYVMQILARQGYGYQFLRPALESASLSLIDQAERDDAAPVALFLLSMACREAGSDQVLELAAERIAARMPLEVGLAIGIETATDKRKSAVLKKFDKRLKDTLRESKGIENLARDLQTKPIKLLKAQ